MHDLFIPPKSSDSDFDLISIEQFSDAFPVPQVPNVKDLEYWTADELKAWLETASPEIAEILNPENVSGAELSKFRTKEALMNRFLDLTGRQLNWLLTKLISK